MKFFYRSIVAKSARRPVVWLLLVLLSIAPALGYPTSVQAEPQDVQPGCHFGITAPYDIDAYDMATIGVDAFLNWGVTRPGGLPDNISHTKVLRIRDDVYTSTRNSLPGWLAAYPGQVWIIGNEPDTYIHNQDGGYQDSTIDVTRTTPEIYGRRYLELAGDIRSLDPTAKIGFGPVVQPTPIRMEYLNRALARMDSITGSRANSLTYVDIFTPHAFILNEVLGQWGAGIPPGFPDENPDAFVITYDFAKTHDINVFTAWMTDFRQWMKNIGAQDKPLWITEYGSLLPPEDPPGGPNYVNVTDADTTQYMLQTLDFIYTAKDPTIGYNPPLGHPGDEYRLVQKAYWYSLNEYRYHFGGSLFNPINKARTLVGDAYLAYDPPVSQVPQDPYPISANPTPLHYTLGSGKTHVDYRVEVRVGNNVTAEKQAPVVVNLTVDGIPLTPQAGNLTRCGGVRGFSFDWPDVDPSALHHIQVTVNPDGGLVDTNLDNNTLEFDPSLFLPTELFLPLMNR